MGCSNSDVQHVGIDGRAVPLARADATLPGRDDLRAQRMVLERSERLRRLTRIADHTSVLGDQRDAARHQLAQAIGFDVEGRALECGDLREEIGD